MGKKRGVKLTRLELVVMDALWGLGQASVRELQEQLPERKRPAYTTVQTIVYRLEEKGAVRRVKKVGNAHVFEAVVTRRAAHRRLLDELLDLFGSPRTLMAHLAEAGKLTLDDVRELESTLARLKHAARSAQENPKKRRKGAGRREGGGR